MNTSRVSTFYKLISSPINKPNVGQMISGLANAGNTNAVSIIINNKNGVENIYLVINTYNFDESACFRNHRNNKSIVSDFLMSNAYVFDEISKLEYQAQDFPANASRFIKKSSLKTMYVSPSVEGFNLSEIISAVSSIQNSQVRIDLMAMHLDFNETMKLYRMEKAINRQSNNRGISNGTINSVKDLSSSSCHAYINIVLKTYDSCDIHALSSEVQAAFVNTATSVGNFPLGIANNYNPLTANNYITTVYAYRLPQEYWSFSDAIKVFCPPYSNNHYTGLELSATSYLPEIGSVPILSGVEYPFLIGNTSQKRRPYYVSLKHFIKSAVISGLPRFGKTFFAKRLILGFHDHRIPVLIVDPTKNEFRNLVDSIPDLKIYTAEDRINPLHFNPFIPPHNVTIKKWKGYLSEAFSSLIPMDAPLPQVINAAINQLYLKFNLSDNCTASDITRTIKWEDFNSIVTTLLNGRYSNRVREDIKTAIEFRIMNLSTTCPITFGDYTTNTSIERLLDGTVVVELGSVTNEYKALILSLVLANIRAYTEANYPSFQGSVRNAIVIDEAHTVLDLNADANVSKLISNSVIYNIKSSIAESAGRGLGTVIIDQCPSKLGSIVDIVGYHMAFKLRGREAQIINETINGVNSGNHNVENALPLLKTREFVFLDQNRSSPIVIENLCDNNVYHQISDDELRKKLRN